MPRTITALLLAALAGPTALAGELFSIEGQTISPVSYAAPEPTTTQVNALAAQAAVPLPAGEGRYLVPGLSYRLEAPRFIDPPEGALPSPLLHEAELTLAALQPLSERWSLSGRIGVGLAGDLEAIDGGVVRVTGLALGVHTFSETLQAGLGLAGTYAFGQLLPVPLLRLRWQPREDLELDALLPSHADLIWTPWDRVRLGLLAELVGNEYAVRLEDALAIYPELDHIAYTDGSVGAMAGARLGGDLWLEAQAGDSFFRRFSLLDADNEPIQDGDQRLDSAGFARLRLVWIY